MNIGGNALIDNRVSNLKKMKVVARVFGGIGNQLFIFAAARAVALRNQSELVLDDTSGFLDDREYKRSFQLGHFNIKCRSASRIERFFPFPKFQRAVMRGVYSRLPFEDRAYIQQVGVSFEERLVSLRIKRNLYLEGYWQSERYFQDFIPQIRKDLVITAPLDVKNKNLSKAIKSVNSVAIHFRFFHKPTISSSGSWCIQHKMRDYYSRAVSIIESRLNHAHYFVFSDRPFDARMVLGLPEGRVTFVNHNQGDDLAYADLWLMSQCRHFVIANSTFSWWGAWLSENPSKIVVAPGLVDDNDVGAWGFAGLLPEEWIRC